MIVSRPKRFSPELFILIALTVGLVVSASIIFFTTGQRNEVSVPGRKAVEPLDFRRLEQLMHRADTGVKSAVPDRTLFVGELRVVAIGSAYPIPYEAGICPYSGIPQPAMNQLDRDGDGITDDWEQKYGLDRYRTSDALEDFDADSFSNLEEFQAGTSPQNADDHPAYAEKLRFVQRKDMPFPLVFQGFMEQSDGKIMFQLNNPATGKTHFAGIGESVESVKVKRFKMDEDGRDHRLYVTRGRHEIELIRGESALDPESKAELINILDRSSIMVTMGALLSLHNDEYAVLGVYPDKVVLKDTRTGKVYNIVGLTEEERIRFSEEML